MHTVQSIRLLLAALVSSLFVAACGGGGTAPETTPAPNATRAALPILSTDEEPTGPLQQLDPTYFATQAGDSYEFVTTDSQGGQTIAGSRAVTAHPTASNGFVLEDSEGSDEWVTVYLRDAAGWHQDFRFYSDLPAQAREIYGTMLEFPATVANSAQSRRSVRQGPWGEDLDGDQVSESFRFEFSQRFMGIEPEVYFGKTITVAHFQTTTTFSMVYSRADIATKTYVITEDTYFAQGFGQIRILTTERDINSKASASSWRTELKEATSGGKSWTDYIRTNGTKIAVDLTFRDIVYDKHRNVYYASIPASDLVDVTKPARVPAGANSIATIDAATGSVTYSAPVGYGTPGPLAMASDGSVLWVGVDDTLEVVQVSLPDMTVTARKNFGSDLYAETIAAPVSQLQPSPTDPSVFAAVLGGSNGGRSVATILVKNMTLLPNVLTKTPDQIPDYSPHINLVTFDDTGSNLFGIDTYDSALLSRVKITDTGLERDSVTSYGFLRASGTHLDFLNNVLVTENKFISTDVPSLSYAGVGAIYCRKLTAEKAVCLRNQVDASNFITGLELVPISMSGRTEGTAISVGSASGQNVTAMAVGGNGQVAIGWREGVSTSGSPSNRLALFRNTELR